MTRVKPALPDTADTLLDFMQANIPLARAAGARLHGYDDTGLILTAPLAANSNHHGTAFGGSLYLVALAAAWGLAHLRGAAAEPGAALYVRHAQADYRRGIDTDLIARALAPDPQALARFAADLRQSGRARLPVTAVVNPRHRADSPPHDSAFVLQATFAAVMATPA